MTRLSRVRPRKSAGIPTNPNKQIICQTENSKTIRIETAVERRGDQRCLYKEATLLIPQMTPLCHSPFENEEIKSGIIDIERHQPNAERIVAANWRMSLNLDSNHSIPADRVPDSGRFGQLVTAYRHGKRRPKRCAPSTRTARSHNKTSQSANSVSFGQQRIPNLRKSKICRPKQLAPQP